MLAQQWPGRPDARGCAGEAHRRGDLTHRPERGVWRVDKTVARGQVWVVEDLPEILQHAARHARRLQPLDPVRAALRARHRLDGGNQRVAVLLAQVVLFVARIVDQRVQSEDGAERAPVLGRGRAGGEVAVGAAQSLVRRGRLMRGALGLGDLAGREVAARLPDRQRHAALEERHVDELPFAVRGARVQGRYRCQRAVQRAGQVGNRHADLHRLAALGAGDAHQAAHALRDDVEPGQLRVGPGLAPARGRDVDQSAIERAQLGVVKPSSAIVPGRRFSTTMSADAASAEDLLPSSA